MRQPEVVLAEIEQRPHEQCAEYQPAACGRRRRRRHLGDVADEREGALRERRVEPSAHGVCPCVIAENQYHREGDENRDGDCQEDSDVVALALHLHVVAYLQAIGHGGGDERLDVQEHDGIIDDERREEAGRGEGLVHAEEVADDVEGAGMRLEAQHTAFRDGANQADGEDHEDADAEHRIEEIDAQQLPQADDESREAEEEEARCDAQLTVFGRADFAKRVGAHGAQQHLLAFPQHKAGEDQQGPRAEGGLEVVGVPPFRREGALIRAIPEGNHAQQQDKVEDVEEPEGEGDLLRDEKRQAHKREHHG